MPDITYAEIVTRLKALGVRQSTATSFAASLSDAGITFPSDKALRRAFGTWALKSGTDLNLDEMNALVGGEEAPPTPAGEGLEGAAKDLLLEALAALKAEFTAGQKAPPPETLDSWLLEGEALPKEEPGEEDQLKTKLDRLFQLTNEILPERKPGQSDVYRDALGQFTSIGSKVMFDVYEMIFKAGEEMAEPSQAIQFISTALPLINAALGIDEADMKRQAANMTELKYQDTKDFAVADIMLKIYDRKLTDRDYVEGVRQFNEAQDLARDRFELDQEKIDIERLATKGDIEYKQGYIDILKEQTGVSREQLAELTRGNKAAEENARQQQELDKQIAAQADTTQRFIAEGNWADAAKSRAMEREWQLRKQNLDFIGSVLSSPTSLFTAGVLGATTLPGQEELGITENIGQLLSRGSQTALSDISRMTGIPTVFPGVSSRAALPSRQSFQGLGDTRQKQLIAQLGLQGISPEEALTRIQSSAPESFAGQVRKVVG